MPRGRSSILNERTFRPVQRALPPYVEEACQDQNHEHEHFHERDHLQFPENDDPGIEKDRFNIEQDKEHAHQIEFHREALAGGADGRHPALVGRFFDLALDLLTQEERAANQTDGQTHSQQRLD